MRDYEPRRPAGRVEDYTDAFLWMSALIVFMGLFVLWAVYGYLASLACALFLRGLIALFDR